VYGNAPSNFHSCVKAHIEAGFPRCEVKMKFKTCLWGIALSLLIAETFANTGMVNTEEYHNHSQPQWEWAMQAIDSYPWTGCERTLDVGCGDGKVTAALSKRLSQGIVIGADISSAMVKYASKSFRHSDHANLLFMRADALDLPFTEQFDVVTSFTTLHWVLDQATALRQIKQCLVENGLALLLLPEKSPANLARLCDQLVANEKWAAFFPSYSCPRIYFTKAEYEILLEDAGLLPCSIDILETEMIFPDKEGIRHWIRPCVTFIDHLSPEAQIAFIDDLTDMMHQIGEHTSEGNIRIRNPMLLVIATTQSCCRIEESGPCGAEENAL
jgi:trans-aconitate methyltransferase